MFIEKFIDCGRYLQARKRAASVVVMDAEAGVAPGEPGLPATPAEAFIKLLEKVFHRHHCNGTIGNVRPIGGRSFRDGAQYYHDMNMCTLWYEEKISGKNGDKYTTRIARITWRQA